MKKCFVCSVGKDEKGSLIVYNIKNKNLKINMG